MMLKSSKKYKHDSVSTVKQWLESIPERPVTDSDITLSLQDEDSGKGPHNNNKNVRFVTTSETSEMSRHVEMISVQLLKRCAEERRPDFLTNHRSLYLRGNTLVTKNTETSCQNQPKVVKRDDIPKRVTFERRDSSVLRVATTENQFKSKIQQSSESSHLLHQMHLYLRGVTAKRVQKPPVETKVAPRPDSKVKGVQKPPVEDAKVAPCPDSKEMNSRPTVQDPPPSPENDSITPRFATTHIDDSMLDAQSPVKNKHLGGVMDRLSQFSGSQRARSASIRRISFQGPKALHLAGKNRVTEPIFLKPVIHGLVVDSVYNRNPSIVRASNNANVREEFALRQRVTGYRVTCTENVSQLEQQQRKMNSNLEQLKSKMASGTTTPSGANNTVVVESQRNKKISESERQFHRNKGYSPLPAQHGIPYTFPPLAYPQRRTLTVS